VEVEYDIKSLYNNSFSGMFCEKEVIGLKGLESQKKKSILNKEA